MDFNMRKIQEQVIFEAVQSASNTETAKEIVYGNNDQHKSEDDACWVKSTMSRLEKSFDEPKVKQIRMNCQCGYGIDEKIELVKDLVASSSNLEELACLDKAKAAGLSTKNKELYLQFPFCPCPMLANVDRLETNTWCQCTTGYSKVLFEKAFGCDVEVELLQSVKMGDPICLMKIIPLGDIWK